jgi:hypothetical protein
MRSREVYSCSPAFSSLAPCQNQYRYDSGVLAALMASTWRSRQQHAMKTSILVNCPWGSALTCRVAPVHFRPPSVEPPCTCSPSKPHGPPATGPISVQWRELSSQWTVVGLSTSQAWGPHPLAARFRVLSTCTSRTRSCCSRWWRVRFPWRTIQAVTLSFSSQILDTRPVVTISPPTSSLTCQSPPTSSYCTRRQLAWSHCRPRSGLLTWHPSLQLPTVYVSSLSLT